MSTTTATDSVALAPLALTSDVTEKSLFSSLDHAIRVANARRTFSPGLFKLLEKRGVWREQPETPEYPIDPIMSTDKK